MMLPAQTLGTDSSPSGRHLDRWVDPRLLGQAGKLSERMQKLAWKPSGTSRVLKWMLKYDVEKISLYSILYFSKAHKNPSAAYWGKGE